jgi:hypothetical protein
MNQKIINYNDFDFANSTVIKPHTSLDVNNTKSTFVVIDSRDRDVTQYQHPSDYVVELNEELQDLISAELVVAHIPFKSYIVNTSNNCLNVTVNTTTRDVILEAANYTEASLASALTTAMNSAFLGITSFEVTYDELYDKYSITSTTPYQLTFRQRDKSDYVPRSMGKLLGFDRKNYDVSIANPYGAYKITAPFRKNFDDAQYIVMNVDTFTVNNSVNSIVNKSFAVIPDKRLALNVQTSTHRIIKNFNPPISRLAKLRIRFTDFYGNLCDFQNHDHRLEIVFQSHKQVRRYQAYFDN